MSNKILLIDSNSLVHRAYHALPNLKSTKGIYTGAIYGYLTLLLKLIKEQKPTHIAAAFDLKAPTFRHKAYDGYKATRKPMDAELACQIEPLKTILDLMKIKVVSLEGYEADDILGTLSKRFDDETIIVTGDKDSFQLVGDTTRIFWTKKGVTDVEVITVESLKEMGFTPDTFIDYKGLRGDTSDNIPGIAGVGEKTAMQLLEKYGDLEGVLAHANEIEGKIGEKVRDGVESARMSRWLATINRDAPVECTLDDIKFENAFSQDVKSYLQDLELGSIVNRMTFDENNDVATRKIEKTIVELSTIDAVKEHLKGDEIAVLFGDRISFATDDKTEYQICCGDDLFAELTVDSAIDVIKENVKDKKLICYDYKSISKQYGIEAEEFFDVMISTHLCRDSATIKSVETVIGDGGAVELFATYLENVVTLKNNGLEHLFYDVEQPLAIVLRNMEERGFAVDASRFDVLEEKYSKILDGIQKEIFDVAGYEFNIASPKQLGEFLFERLGLKHGKKNKTGSYSVSEDVLDKLRFESPVIEKILDFRRFSKLLSTYVVGLKPLINRGKIHTEFNQCITATGRLSSTNPNLQNIPVRTEDGKDIKSAFVPSNGNVLISADYSQIELRLLAHFSADEKLIEAYNRADDIHALTASQILGKPIDEVTSNERRDAKAVNFGIIYGMSDFGLSENLSVPVYVAKEFIERYFATYPTVKAYLDGNVDGARERGYSLTLLGRRRNLSDLKASNFNIRSAAERMAKNTPLQGSAADIVKVAMIRVEKRLENMKSKMILQVHDELIIDATPDEKEQVEKILKEEMEHAFDLRVPLIVDVSSADRWDLL